MTASHTIPAKSGGGRPQRIIVLGAQSAIAEATARLYAGDGAHLVLAGRDEQRLAQIAADLQARGAAGCTVMALDLAALGSADRMADMVAALDGTVDAVLVFYGALGDQKQAETDLVAARHLIAVNFSSAAEWCLVAAAVLERQNAGCLIAVSSVAGDRGRQSNYVYGSAKSGLTILVQGIAHRLAVGKARAVVVKLGFVDTPMTAHIKKGSPLWAKPAAIAVRLKQIVEKGSAPVVYVPSFWRPIMFVITHVPTAIFHRTKL